MSALLHSYLCGRKAAEWLITMKKLISLCLCTTLLLCLLPCVAFAEEDPTGQSTVVAVFEDGSYCVTTIIQEEVASSSRASTQIKTGTKAKNYYNASGVLQFTLIVRGTFSYDGSTATATKAQYGYSISQTAWTFVSARTTRNGATATAIGTFRQSGTYDRTLSVSLTCSPDGVLS